MPTELFIRTVAGRRARIYDSDMVAQSRERIFVEPFTPKLVTVQSTPT